ncbi:diguanylate cyclase domain-containing protein [Ectothiorhodospira sp. BSL-9]|uniref:diguanylate cyclase domain-containing protein n=1 Tax=Ectothiorhodospira sp. BSL-9 TaxID=1442136 RepID=UPI00143BCE17|nr:GGDEF domain-containing protein [Ectothiorhodospira sp. BSL-9]
MSGRFLQIDARGEVTHYIRLAEDISDKRALNEGLEYLAFHDPLTGLPNRSVMLDRIGQAIAQGDQLLIHMAQRLRALLREEDTVARFGGDEFILLLPHLARQDRSVLRLRHGGRPAHHPEDAAIIRAIIGLGETLGRYPQPGSVASTHQLLTSA